MKFSLKDQDHAEDGGLGEQGDDDTAALNGDDDLVPETVSGRGTVLTYTVNHHSYRPGVPVPYVIALVELAEDASIRLPTNIVGCEPEDVHIGMPVRAMFEEWGDLAVPLFEPER